VAALACTLFFTFMDYSDHKADYDEEFCQKAYEVQRRYE
jgi:hypothetical protein